MLLVVRSFSKALLIVLTAFGICGQAFSCFAAETALEQEEREQIAQLIEQLGSSNYATRVEAESSLRMLGVRALDQLKDARNHKNQQVARFAEYLLYSNDIVWYFEADSPRVRKLLRNYGADAPMERALTLQRLALLEADEGVAALARIARYESNGDLAKQAAITLMRLSDSHLTLERLTSRWNTVQKVVESGKNAASVWLQHYAQAYHRSIAQTPANFRQDISKFAEGLQLLQPLSNSDYRMPPLGLVKLQSYQVKISATEDESSWWNKQIEDELQLLHTPSRDTSLSTIDQLCRTACEFLLRCDRREEAFKIATKLKTLPTINTDLSSTLDRSVWAIDHGLPQLAVDLLEAEPKTPAQGQVADMQRAFRDSTYWQYHLAEAYRWLGDNEKSEKAYARANEVRESFFDRRSIVEHLQQRCLFDWAEEEFVRGLEDSQQPSSQFWVGIMYAHFLQEGRDFQKAFEIYDEQFKLLETNDELRKQVEDTRFGGDQDTLKSNYLYIKGMAELERKDFDAAKKSFREAIELAPSNVDVVIELYRLQGDQEYKAEIEELIENTLELLLLEAKNAELLLREATSEDFATKRRDYANSLNTYAWLLCNIDRDFDLALNASIVSNKLETSRPEYADTLARCYFVVGDIKKAIYWQERALSFSPSQRQLLITLLDYYSQDSTRAAN